MTRQHIIMTPDDCGCDGSRACPICDGGLAVCKVCRKAEIELDQCPDCPGPPDHSELRKVLGDALKATRQA